MTQIYDITIVGAGPVGLFAGTYSLMRQAKVQIIESRFEIGGQVSALFPAKQIYDIPGYFKISGADLISNLAEQINFFKPEIHLNETVINFERTENGVFKITTNLRTTFSKSIILATGAGAFEPRKLKLDNAIDLENKLIFYNITDPEKFKNKEVVITGGGNSAVDWALELSNIAKHVTVIHRREQFRALESTVDSIKKHPNISILTPFMINQVNQENNQIKITLKKTRTVDEFTDFIADAMIVNYGFKSDSHIIRKWGLEFEKNKIKVNSNQQTSQSGIYAIGDIAYQEGNVELIASGFGEAPIAINHALNTIYPDKRQATHSTQLMKNFNV